MTTYKQAIEQRPVSWRDITERLMRQALAEAQRKADAARAENWTRR